MNTELLGKWDLVKKGYRLLLTARDLDVLSDHFVDNDGGNADLFFRDFATDNSKRFPGLFIGYIKNHPNPKFMGLGGEL